MSYERRYLPIGRTVSAESIGTLSDVTLSSAANGDRLQYNGTAWVNIPDTLENLTDTTISSASAGEVLSWDGSAWINNTDFALNISGIADGEVLQYNSGSGTWVNVSVASLIAEDESGYPEQLGYAGI